MSSPDLGHGEVGQREQNFTNLLPLRANGYDIAKLALLANEMIAQLDTVKDGADPEENLWLPAGYTYFGQFIDHDLTFDNTSSLDPNNTRLGTNLRSPRFDLDCLYGDGPDAQPYMYENKGTGAGIKLLTGGAPKGTIYAENDLPRNLPLDKQGRAIIGDKRNDENSIICQIQRAFINFHNKVADKFIAENDALDFKKKLSTKLLFVKVRNEVRWTYQKLVIEDFLPRIVHHKVLENLTDAYLNKDNEKLNMAALRAKNYALYTWDKRGNLPLEFVGAAYRFGHSGVRTGYRLNKMKLDPTNCASRSGRASIFDQNPKSPSVESMVGFEPLKAEHEIDNWRRFFPYYGSKKEDLPPTLGHPPQNTTKDGIEPEDVNCRMQFAYKIDTMLVDPLGFLPDSVSSSSKEESIAALNNRPRPAPHIPNDFKPSLALLNLLRGNVYRIASGQEVVKVLKAKGFKFKELVKEDLVIRKKFDATQQVFKLLESFNTDETKLNDFVEDTPLWFYILAEAQAPLKKALNVHANIPFLEERLKENETNLTQLGWVGGRIVAEVFYGLMDSDSESYVHNDWTPTFDQISTVLGLLEIAEPDKVKKCECL